jgi:hypothetical protein
MDTHRSRPRLGHLLLAAGGAFFVVWTQLVASIGLRGGMEPLSLRDFGSLWASGNLANQGLNPYGEHSSTFRVTTPGGQWSAVNLNPPFSVLLFQPLARLDPALGFRALQVASAMGYVMLILVLIHHTPTPDAWLRVLLLFLWHPFWSTLELGQIYVLLLPLAAAGLLLGERRPILAGVCIGLLVALKPPYVIWPLLLLVGRHGRPALVGLGTAAILTLLPAVFGHLDWYPEWIAAARTASALQYLHDNLSALALLTRLGVPPLAAIAAMATALTALAVLVWQRRWAAPRISAIALIASWWASPVAWVGYALWLGPIFLSHRYWPEALLIAAVLFAIPGPLLWWSAPQAYLVYTVATALCLYSLLRYGSSEGPVGTQTDGLPAIPRMPDPTRSPW